MQASPLVRVSRRPAPPWNEVRALAPQPRLFPWRSRMPPYSQSCLRALQQLRRRCLAQFLRTHPYRLIQRLQWEDSGRVRVTLGSGLRTDSCPATEISDSATPPDGVWSKEGDRTPTLDVLITRIIPARFAHCQQTIAKIRRIQSRVSPDECYAMMISKLCFTPVHDGGRVDFAYRNGPACRISLR